MSDTLRLAEALIALPSVTPRDAGCLDLIGQRLAALGFALERMDSGPDDFRVSNLWARRGTGQRPTLVFAGHTDVVPTGPVEQWGSDPFVPTVRDGNLYRTGDAPPPGTRTGSSDEFRLTERWTSSAKSVFLFDVQGSVAKSTHAGIPWLKWLREQAGERLHVWPFDGWAIPSEKPVMVSYSHLLNLFPQYQDFPHRSFFN